MTNNVKGGISTLSRNFKRGDKVRLIPFEEAEEVCRKIEFLSNPSGASVYGIRRDVYNWVQGMGVLTIESVERNTYTLMGDVFEFHFPGQFLRRVPSDYGKKRTKQS